METHGAAVRNTGARWKDLPREYPPYQTCHRRFQQWVRDGTVVKALQVLAEDLRESGGFDIREAFIDGTFSSARKGGFALARRNAARGARSWAKEDAHGLPVAVCVAGASSHEVTLVEETIDASFLEKAPQRLIGDKAYDSDPLDERLQRERNVELIAPHRDNRRRPPSQYGRALRRYRRRWHVERLFAWPHNFRRIVTRYDYYPMNYLGFVQLGCLVILMRQF